MYRLSLTAFFLSIALVSPATADDVPKLAPLPVPDLSELESQHLSNHRQVTSGLPRAGEGYFSPDGKQIIYQGYPAR